MESVTQRSRCAFTLIELLVVITVIGILAAIIGVAVNHGLISAKETTCRSNLRSLGLALEAEFMEDLAIPADLRITDVQTFIPEQPVRVGTFRTAGPSLACFPTFIHPPPEPIDSSIGQAASALKLFDLPYCPMAPPNPVFAIDPQNEPKARSFGIRYSMLGKSLDQAGWLLAESNLRHLMGPEDLAMRHRGHVHVYRAGGSVRPMLKEDISFE